MNGTSQPRSRSATAIRCLKNVGLGIAMVLVAVPILSIILPVGLVAVVGMAVFCSLTAFPRSAAVVLAASAISASYWLGGDMSAPIDGHELGAWMVLASLLIGFGAGASVTHGTPSRGTEVGMSLAQLAAIAIGTSMPIFAWNWYAGSGMTWLVLAVLSLSATIGYFCAEMLGDGRGYALSTTAACAVFAYLCLGTLPGLGFEQSRLQYIGWASIAVAVLVGLIGLTGLIERVEEDRRQQQRREQRLREQRLRSLS